ncbi:MAG: FAD-dependent oxidoreductase [archaeon]
MAKEIYDLIILGTGPAGMAAAIYAGRYGMKTLVIGNAIGGTANLAGEVENYPGFTGTGTDLMKKFEEQAKSFGAIFELGNIDKIEKTDNEFHVSVGSAVHGIPSKMGTGVPSSSGKEFFGRSVISGLGSEHRKLEIPGEKKFLGKGVSYCATCDGNFFRGKTVAVIGGCDSAAKAAIYLSDICKKVYISYRKEKMRCDAINLQKVESLGNIEIIYNSRPVEIIGDIKVSGLKLKSSTEEKIGKDLIEVDGVFIEIGATPVTEIFNELGVELENGHIKVDREGRTSIAGLFAAGDVVNNPFKQIITAAGDGSVAAKTAYEFLMGKLFPKDL